MKPACVNPGKEGFLTFGFIYSLPAKHTHILLMENFFRFASEIIRFSEFHLSILPDGIKDTKNPVRNMVDVPKTIVRYV
jgi:hypothetical protein